MPLPKILIIGAGEVGGYSAAVMARMQLGIIYLFDVIRDLAVGKAMDINQASPYLHTDAKVIGCNDLEEIGQPEVIVITAGRARHAGMTRLDLLQQNIETVDRLGSLISARFISAKVLVVTNPVDVLTWYMKTKWPGMSVFGLGCSLDTMRFRYFIAEEVKGSVDCARGIVIGTHNDDMVPLVNHATVGGVPLRHLLDEPTIATIVGRTRRAGTIITQKKKDHSGFYAASHVITQVVESIVFNRLGVFPLSVYCRGEYGFRDICLALPAVAGQNGVERILEMELDENETASLQRCAMEMEKVVGEIRSFTDHQV
jgi:malate dehydrogenase